MQMQTIKRHTRPHKSDTLLLHALHDPVNSRRLAGELAVARERQRAGDVAGVAGVLGAGVEEQQLAAGEGLVVVGVVQGGGVGARGGDDGVGLLLGAVGEAVAEEERVHVALVAAVLEGSEDGFVGGALGVGGLVRLGGVEKGEGWWLSRI
jgi:hypothetical protein